MQKRRINDADIWRIVFTFLIMFFHFNNIFALTVHIPIKHSLGWYIVTDFFFMLSGYLLYEKKDSYPSALSFLKRRVCQIYPVYIISVIVSGIVKVYCEDLIHSVGELVQYFAESLPEILLIDGFGFDRGWNYNNPVAWYIPYYLLAGFILMYFVKEKEKPAKSIIFPIAIVASFSYLFTTKGNLDVTIAHSHSLIHNPPLFRAILGMLAGFYSCELKKYWSDICSGKKLIFLKCSGCISFLLVIAASFKWGYLINDFLYIIFLFFGMSTVFLPWKKENSNNKATVIEKVLMYLSRMTIYYYLFHHVFRDYILPRVFRETWAYSFKVKIAIFIIYVLLVMCVSAIVDIILIAIRKMIRKKKAVNSLL